jgi:hypothetical protein
MRGSGDPHTSYAALSAGLLELNLGEVRPMIGPLLEDLPFARFVDMGGARTTGFTLKLARNENGGVVWPV